MSIKKTIAVLMAIMITGSCCLCACGDKEETADNTQTSQNAVQTKSLADVFGTVKTQVSLSEMVEFQDAASLDRYYGITAQQAVEFAGGINNSGVEQEEIVLIKASDETSAEGIKTALENRRQAKINENRSYNPAQAEMIEKCNVETNGLYVFMIISPNNEQITQIVKAELGL